MKRILCFGDSNTWGLIPGTSERFGDKLLPVMLESHSPLDMVVLMLDTNDCKPVYNADAEIIASGIERLIGQIRAVKGRECRILLISPIELGDDVWKEQYDPQFSRSSPALSRRLKKAYEKVALKYNTELLAASDFANPSNIDCEHLDEQGHNALARAVKDKIISIYGKAAS